MTIQEYQRLDEVSKFEALWMKGIDLISRIDGIYTYTLFTIDGFYVEVQRLKVNDPFPKFRPLFKITDIDPYLDLIEISEITALF